MTNTVSATGTIYFVVFYIIGPVVTSFLAKLIIADCLSLSFLRRQESRLSMSTASDLEDPVQYGFNILGRALANGTQWSIIIDVKQSMIYFKTSIGQEIKYSSWTDFDYNCSSPARIVNINSTCSGDVFDEFGNYSRHQSLILVGDGIKKAFASSNLNPTTILKNCHDYICTTYYDTADPNNTQLACACSMAIENLRTGQQFDSIDCAIALAEPGDEIVIEPGIYQESLFLDKDVTLRSLDPSNRT